MAKFLSLLSLFATFGATLGDDYCDSDCKVTGFYIVDTDAELILDQISDGELIVADYHYGVEARTEGACSRVVFSCNGEVEKIENAYPYVIGGDFDMGAEYIRWNSERCTDSTTGEIQITAVPYYNYNINEGCSKSIKFTVTDPPSPPVRAPPPTPTRSPPPPPQTPAPTRRPPPPPPPPTPGPSHNNTRNLELMDEACHRVVGLGDDPELCEMYDSLPLVVPDCDAESRGHIVPKIYHSVGKGEPELHQQATAAVNPSFERNHHNDTSALEYLGEKCGKVVAEAYKCLAPPAYRADLFRFCALWADGGIYLDGDIVPLVPLEEMYSPCSTATVGHDFPWKDIPGKQMKILAGSPGAEIFKCAMETIVENIKKRAYPETNLLLSGPQMLQQCFEEYPDDVAITHTDTRGAMWPYSGMRAYHKILAYEMPGSSAFTKIELDDKNYNNYFAQKKVYRETCAI